MKFKLLTCLVLLTGLMVTPSLAASITVKDGVVTYDRITFGKSTYKTGYQYTGDYASSSVGQGFVFADGGTCTTGGKMHSWRYNLNNSGYTIGTAIEEDDSLDTSWDYINTSIIGTGVIYCNYNGKALSGFNGVNMYDVTTTTNKSASGYSFKLIDEGYRPYRCNNCGRGVNWTGKGFDIYGARVVTESASVNTLAETKVANSAVIYNGLSNGITIQGSGEVVIDGPTIRRSPEQTVGVIT